jgi:hypothetical protein
MKYFFIGNTEVDCFNTVVSIPFTLRLGIRIKVKHKALLLLSDLAPPPPPLLARIDLLHREKRDWERER